MACAVGFLLVLIKSMT